MARSPDVASKALPISLEIKETTTTTFRSLSQKCVLLLLLLLL